MLPWLQPWLHKKDGCLINYSTDCRAYIRAKDSAAAQPADSDSSTSSGAIRLGARLPGLQSIHRLILPKGFLGKCHSHSCWLSVHRTRHSYTTAAAEATCHYAFLQLALMETGNSSPPLKIYGKTYQHQNVSSLRSIGWIWLIMVSQLDMFISLNAWLRCICIVISGPSCARCSMST